MTLETNPFVNGFTLYGGHSLVFGNCDIDLKIEELSKMWIIELCAAKRSPHIISYDITSVFYDKWKIIKQKCVEYMKTKYFHVHDCVSMLGSMIVKCPKCFEKAHKNTTILTFLEVDFMCDHLPNVTWRPNTHKVIQDRLNITYLHIYLKRMEARDTERKKEQAETARLQTIQNELVAQLVDSLNTKFSTDSELASMVPVFDSSLVNKIRKDYSELEHPGFYDKIMSEATRKANAKIAKLKGDIKLAKQREKEAAEAAKRTEVLLRQEQLREIERLREIVRQKELENKALIDALEAAKTVEMPVETSEDPC